MNATTIATMFMMFVAAAAAGCSDDTARNKQTTDSGVASNQDGGVFAGDSGSAGALPFFEADSHTFPEGVTVARSTITQPGADPVAVIFTTDGLWIWTLDGAAPVKVLSDVPLTGDYVPKAIRVGNTIHVAWGTQSINHAYGTIDGEWSTSVVADGKKPTIAATEDGTVHMGWHSFELEGRTAFYASWNGSSWQSEAVRLVEGTRAAREWAGVASSGTNLWLAGTDTDDSIWLLRRDGDSWAEEALDVSDYVEFGMTYEQQIHAGPAGLAILFNINPILASSGSPRAGTYVSWRPSGGNAFETTIVGEGFTNILESPELVVGESAALVADHNFDLTLLWGLAPDFWPRIGSFSRPIGQGGCLDEFVSISFDSADQPLVMVGGCETIDIFRQAGTYPNDWNERCQSAANELCDLACACGPSGDCGYVFSNGNSPGGNRSGCELSAFDSLCGDSTSTPEEVEACVATFQPAECVELGYPVDDACLPLIE